MPYTLSLVTILSTLLFSTAYAAPTLEKRKGGRGGGGGGGGGGSGPMSGSGWKIFGAVVGSLAGLFLICYVTVKVLNRRQRKENAKHYQNMGRTPSPLLISWDRSPCMTPMPRSPAMTPTYPRSPMLSLVRIPSRAAVREGDGRVSFESVLKVFPTDWLSAGD